MDILFPRYKHRFYWYAVQRWQFSHEAAEDAIQEAFLDIAKGVKGYDEAIGRASNAEAWLWSIYFHVLVFFHRKARRRARNWPPSRPLSAVVAQSNDWLSRDVFREQDLELEALVDCLPRLQEFDPEWWAEATQLREALVMALKTLPRWAYDSFRRGYLQERGPKNKDWRPTLRLLAEELVRQDPSFLETYPLLGQALMGKEG